VLSTAPARIWATVEAQRRDPDAVVLALAADHEIADLEAFYEACRAGLDAAQHRAFLARYYRGDFYGSPALGAAFSSNPAIGDERTCGTAAALCGLSLARAKGDEEGVERALRRLVVLYAVMFGFGGIPLVYMGDELALDNDESYRDDPLLADDSRWLHRPWMPWELAERRLQAGTVEQRMFASMQRLVEVRRLQPAMSAGGQTWIHELPDRAVLAWARLHPRHGRFYGIANFADREAEIPVDALRWAQMELPREVLGTGDLSADGLQLQARLKATAPELPVIVITAHDEPVTAERVRALGASASSPY